MNKTELINAIAEKSGLSKVDSKKALEAFIESVTEEGDRARIFNGLRNQ